MYRPGQRPPHPPPFGPPPPPHGPPGSPLYRLPGPFGPQSGVSPHGHLPTGPFSASAPDFIHNRPTRGHFTHPPCSNFSLDHSRAIALGGSQQIIPPAETPNLQIPQWNPTPVERQPTDNGEKAGEEFLRCIAANKPLPDYLKGNMAYNLADAFMSAKILKEAVKSDPQFQKRATKSKSRSLSRSRGKSRAKSRARSRVRSRSRSRGHSHSQNRERSKSPARGKSQARSKHRARSKSKARSRSRSQKKSRARSKSRARKSRTRSSSSEKSHAKDKKRKRSPTQSHSGSIDNSSKNPPASSLLEGLKMVMNSKELEDRLPSLKDAILTIQASDESKKVHSVIEEQQHDSQENTTSLENDSMLLPHDRVGSDFSWLQTPIKEDSKSDQKTDDFEDEESYLYGKEDTKVQQGSNSTTRPLAPFSQTGELSTSQCNEMDSSGLGSQKHHQNKSIFSSFGDTSLSLVAANLDNNECEKIKNVLKTLGTADISEIMVKMQEQKEGKQLPPAQLTGSDAAESVLALPALANTNVRQALESLQSLIKATKEKRAKSDPLGSGLSQISSDKHKADEERAREKQARKCKMETLIKELEGLLEEDGLSCMTPVIGFFCQKCEEFIGDLITAENHAVMHKHADLSNQNQVPKDKHATDSKGPSHYYNNSSSARYSDKRDQKDYGHHRNTGDHRNHRDHQHDRMDEKDHRSQHDDDHRSHRNGQEKMSLHEELRKERILITVSRGRTPPPNTRINKEANKEHATGKVKPENTDSKGKSSTGDRGKETSSDSSDDDRRKSSKGKSPKKKKKKKEKKKKRVSPQEVMAGDELKEVRPGGIFCCGNIERLGEKSME
ncbi:hypothetical protein LDENG_00040580 [Lucifuga dentata]|nr:hypothetical protein LDENG_00040580 [Lucifuga dentata]